MSESFYEIAFTPGVKEQQSEHGSRRQYERMETALAGHNKLGPDEQQFIALRDSFYMASVSETGWPYIQHRGGPPGFVHILRPDLIAFADLRGNKQYISLGNLSHDNRVALFFMDYPNQTRLKILGHAEIHEHDDVAPELIEQMRTAEPNAIVERAILIHVSGFDWNCPQHITPRYTLAELDPTLAPLRKRLAALEAENVRLRERLKSSEALLGMSAT
jgi:predicted pyridoxine 5'-phosphate oxidase superfamily flavin-nucleotide-binding protein